ERFAAERNDDAAIASLLKALMRTTDREQRRLWLHVRLAQLHDRRGDYVQAASHAAAAYALDDHPVWSELEPDSPMNETSPAALHEAAEQLDRAARTVRSANLQLAIRRMQSTLQPRLRGVNDSRRTTTFSGLTRDEINALDVGAASLPSMPENPTRGQHGDASDLEPDALDALLEARQYAEAIARCDAIAADPGGRSISRFLVQYGIALNGVSRTDEAAVRFSQAAIHEPTSIAGVRALIELALIERRVRKDEESAHRLLVRAEIVAGQIRNDTLARRARQLQKDTDDRRGRS
ncbi:MAG: hypothetical protein AAF432_13555, partial [Planctomycetota bacterium]